VYLVDTNIISAASPARPVPSALVEWMDAHSAVLFLSVVTLAEIEDGIAKSRRERAVRKSADLASWLETVCHLYGAASLLSMRRPPGSPVPSPIVREGTATRRASPTSSSPRLRSVTG